MPLQIRRGTEAERQAMTVPLAEGELLYVTDDQRLFIGGKAADGTPIANGVLVTGYNDIDAKAAAASLFAAGTHSNITFVYDDGTGSISATVDLSNYQDVITANGIKAPILGANDFELFNSATNDLQLNGVISSDVTPKETGIFDLGSPSLTFNNLYLNNALWIGTAEITSDGAAINLPIGSTVNGVLIGADSDTGIVEGSNYRINIIGEDSSLLVNSANGTFFGNLTGSLLSNDGSTLLVNSDNNSINAPGGISGDVTGNVTGSVIGNDGNTLLVDATTNSINAPGGISGDVTGNLTGDVTGNVTGNLIGSVISNDGSTLLVNSDNNSINAPGGISGNVAGNLTGDVTGNVTGNLTGDVTGNLAGDVTGDVTGSVFDNSGSTLIVNAVNGSINAPGGISGNVAGNLTGDVTGNVTGNLTGSVISNDGSTFIVNLFDNSINASGGISGNLSGDVTGNVTGNLTGNVIDSDGLTIVDSLTGTVFGNFIGSVNGDVTGNVISTNGTTIVNSTTNTFNGNFIGSFFGDGSGITGLQIPDINGIVEGSNYRINIIGDDSSLLVNSANGTFFGNLTGSVIGNDGNTLLVNATTNSINAPGGISGNVTGNVTGSVIGNDGNTLLVDATTNSINAPGGVFGDVTGNVVGNLNGNVTGNVTGNLIGDVISTNGTTIVNSSTNTFTGNFVGNGNGITSLPSNIQSVFDLNDVVNIGNLDEGDVLVWDGFNFVNQSIEDLLDIDNLGQLNVNIIGDDSTIMVDVTNNSINAFGGISGDLTGDIFYNDNTLFFDSITKTIYTSSEIISYGNDLTLEGETSNLDTLFRIKAKNASGVLKFKKVSDIDLSSDSESYGIISFEREDINGRVSTAQIFGGGSDGAIYFAADSEGLPSPTLGEQATLAWVNGNLGVGKFVPTESLDVSGNALVSGNLTANTIVGDITTDGSTKIIDSSGNLFTGNIDIIGITTSTPNDAETVDQWLQVNVNGNTRYIPLYS